MRGCSRLFSLPTLAGVDLARSSPLEPPWPDLVICSGRGAEAVAFWLKRQNPKLRIVFVGSPWSEARAFDLVITTPQYRLPRAPNVLHNTLPLHDVTPERLAAEARRWEARLAASAAAVHGGAGGGQQRALHLHAGRCRTARPRGDATRQAEGGSLLVTTSARTREAVADALAPPSARRIFSTAGRGPRRTIPSMPSWACRRGSW